MLVVVGYGHDAGDRIDSMEFNKHGGGGCGMKTLERRGEDRKYRLFNGIAGHFYNLLSVVLEYFVSICRVIFQSDRLKNSERIAATVFS